MKFTQKYNVSFHYYGYEAIKMLQKRTEIRANRNRNKKFPIIYNVTENAKNLKKHSSPKEKMNRRPIDERIKERLFFVFYQMGTMNGIERNKNHWLPFFLFSPFIALF